MAAHLNPGALWLAVLVLTGADLRIATAMKPAVDGWPSSSFAGSHNWLVALARVT
jgi:hypothetical protein